MNVMNFGGISLSCCDSDKSAIVVFMAGCPYMCYYCHNSELRTTKNFINIEKVKEMIRPNADLVSEVIFSGGEPLAQIPALTELAEFVKNLGLLVGVETSGYNSNAAIPLFKGGLIDRIYLDFKTSPSLYTKLTGYEYAFRDVYDMMLSCRDMKIPCELRVTDAREYVNPKIIELVEKLAKDFGFGFRVQKCSEWNHNQ